SRGPSPLSPNINFIPDVSNACKFPGGSVPDWEKATRYPLTIENLSNETVTITPGALTMDGNRNDQDAGRFYSADGCPPGGSNQHRDHPRGRVAHLLLRCQEHLEQRKL